MGNTIFFSILAIVILFSFCIAYRNHVAFKIRTKILYLDPPFVGLELYDELPTYKQMVFNFRRPLTYDYWVNYAYSKLKEKSQQKINRNDSERTNRETKNSRS